MALAALSYASWSASLRGKRLRAVLQQSGYQRVLLIAGCLICAGLGLTAVSGLETAWWSILALISVATFISLWRKARRNP